MSHICSPPMIPPVVNDQRPYTEDKSDNLGPYDAPRKSPWRTIA
jgi:hypothetical protein